MKRLVPILATLFIVFSCIDPIRVIVEEGVGILVVDGLVTDSPDDPVVIRVSRSTNFDNTRPQRVFTIPERNATIIVFDDVGNSTTLVETEPGVYESTGFVGTQGRSYHTEIELANGKRYVSEPDKMPPVATLQTIEPEFTVYDRRFINANKQPVTVPQSAFHIYAVVDDPSGLGNYYRWEADGIYEFFTSTENPAVGTCWVYLTRLESKLEIADDVLFDGKTYRHRICTIPYDRQTRYMVKGRQYSLSEQAHQYWERAAFQQTSTGSLFDPPPSPIRSNIKSVSDPGETVIGFVGASAVSKISYLFDRLEASGYKDANIYPPVLEFGDCRLLIPGATNIRPEGF